VCRAADRRRWPPESGETAVPVDDRITVVLCGRRLEAADRRIVEAFAAQAAVALRQERLAEEAATARPLAAADRMRTALLAAVSHDLRTPLASAKAAVTSLRSHDIEFDESDREELLETAEESLDRLARLVGNLLDMSRLQAGVLGISATAIGLEDAVPLALDELGPAAATVGTDIPADLPAATADPGLLERVLVNIVANALRYSPPGQPPTITASAHAGQVELRVIDRGPGIPEDQWEHVFLPFQRLGDRDNQTGVGLGLALSRGLAEAMGGSITPETTPGGGLTMVLRLPAAPTGSEGSQE
jgi:two-component system, OmpR family, sensor histidine kinase KdpD